MRLDWDEQKVLDIIDQAIADGIADGAEHILEHANRSVPIEEGTLGRSGFVAMRKGTVAKTFGDAGNLEVRRTGRVSESGPTITAVVAYDTPYAVRQHEDTSIRHDPGRRAKCCNSPSTSVPRRSASSSPIGEISRPSVS